MVTKVDSCIDEIQHSIDYLFDFWSKKPVYFLISVIYYIISSMLIGGTLKCFLIVLAVYIISLIFCFSCLGEKFLRMLYRVRPIETRQERDFLQPLFDDVYEQAKTRKKKLHNIEVCIIDDMSVNAVALGRRTIAVTKGAMQTFTEDELKAVMAHEIAHIVYGDTIAVMYSVIGNGILSLFVMAVRCIFVIIETVKYDPNRKKGGSWALLMLFRVLFEFFVWNCNLGLQLILSANSRKSELRADKFAYDIGYDTEMIEALYFLEKISLGDNSSVIQKMTSSHPRITLRIKMLEELEQNQELLYSVSP